MPGIDEQHRELFRRMEKLSQGLAELAERDVLPQVIETALYLRKYVDVHFTAEEELMRKLEYPAFGEHLLAHDSMRNQLGVLIDAFLKDHKSLTFNLMDFLVTWLLDHINTHDRKLGEFMHQA